MSRLGTGYRFFVALVLGVLMPLGFSPFNLWPLACLTPAGLFFLCHRARPLAASGYGFFFGLGSFGCGVSWVFVSIYRFGHTSFGLALFLTALFIVFLAFMFVGLMILSWRSFLRFWASYSLPLAIVSFCFFWVGFEWVRSGFLSGFPWLYVGTAMVASPLAAWLPVLGVFGAGFLVLFMVMSLLACCFCKKNKRQLCMMVALSLVLVFSPLYWLHKTQWTQSFGKPIRVALVQGNINQNLKWSPSMEEAIWQEHLRLSSPYWRDRLVVWPENAIPRLYPDSLSMVDSLQSIAKRYNSLVIVGLPVLQETTVKRRFYNAMMSIDSRSKHLYFKQKLVPFGEYVPFEKELRGLIYFFNLPMSDFSAGAPNQPLLRVGPYRITPYICYEVVYPSLSAERANGSDFLLTISNDAWFGHSLGAAQHLQMSQVAALQAGRFMLQATNNGITAIISPKGKLLARLAPFKSGVLLGSIQRVSGVTPFMRVPFITQILLGFLALLCFLCGLYFPKKAQGV